MVSISWCPWKIRQKKVDIKGFTGLSIKVPGNNSLFSTARSILVPAVAMINIEQGRRWKHYQLTTTNQFKLEETLMQRVFESFGYQFTIVTPKDSEPHFIAKEVSEALGYSKTSTLV